MMQPATLNELSQQQADQLGDKRLFIYQDEAVTFSEFDKRARAVADALLAEGLVKGDRIGFLGKNHPAYFELLFGAAHVGIVIVPLNWRLSKDELAWIAADARLKLVVAQQEFVDQLSGADIDATNTVRLIELERDFADWRENAPKNRYAPGVAPDDIAVQLYTSGTTGRPKGALLTHRNLLHYRSLPRERQPEWNRFDPDDVGLLVMPVFHIGGTGFGVQIIAAGASALVATEFDADFVLDAIANEGLSKIFVVPTALRMLVDHPRARQVNYARIRTLLYGASPIPLDLLREAMNLFECGFVQMYGMTETTGTICALIPEDHDPDGNQRMRSAGRPLDGVEIAIRDPEGADLPAGQTGEICIHAPTVMAGYWMREEATREVLSADGWFHSGDAGYLDDAGYLYLVDRVKDMIVTGGENVYPAEVERVIEQHPDVAQVAVIGTPCPKWGEQVTAVIVPVRPDHAEAAAIVAAARESLAGYKLPKQVHFVSALPRNATGKVLRRTLRDQFAGPALPKS